MQISVRQLSGLGNQLFQYAAGLYFARRYNAALRIVVDPPRNAQSHGFARPFQLAHFNIPAPFSPATALDHLALSTRLSQRLVSAPFRTLRGIGVYREALSERFQFLPDLPSPLPRHLYLAGFWQAAAFAHAVQPELRSHLTFRDPPTGRTLDLMNHIQQSAQPVSLHMRRGDYTLAIEGNRVLPLDFYTRALALIHQKLADPTFFVFSDDIAFARANLPPGLRTVFVDHTDAATAFDDIRLMSACHHHIIANSSFSWWGAWLNPRPEKTVIAPRHWMLTADSHYPQLFPPGWLTLDTVRPPGPHLPAEPSHRVL